MKAVRPLVFVALCGLLSTAYADTVVISDTFSGVSLDTATWSTVLPFGSSSVVQSGGNITTTGRGILGTQAGIAGPYVINGVFTMNSDLEHFDVAFRTNLAGSDFGERQGMLVSFSNDGNQVSIQRYTSAASADLLAVANYTLTTGQGYAFSLYDDGFNVSLSVNGVDLLSATSAYSTGDHIGFYSREFSNTSTSIDSVIISRVPDVGITALYLGIALGILGSAKRRA